MSTKLFEGYKEQAYSLMRFFLGFLFACHGAQKVFGILGRDQADSLLMWVAGTVELFGGLAIALGVFTSIAAFLCAGQVLVAYFYAHAFQALLPIQNRGELALLYFFAFLVIMTRGAGCCALMKDK